jgi:hypothetical protein
MKNFLTEKFSGKGLSGEEFHDGNFSCYLFLREELWICIVTFKKSGGEYFNEELPGNPEINFICELRKNNNVILKPDCKNVKEQQKGCKSKNTFTKSLLSPSIITTMSGRTKSDSN